MANRGPLTIAVLLKQVPDMNVVRIDRASGRIVTAAQLVMSSYDEYAIEAALRIKESFGGEIVAVSAGPPAVKDVLTRALAMGADRAIHLLAADIALADSLSLAGLLADAVAPLNCDLVLAGQASDDIETGQVGAQVAALLGVPVISNVVSLEFRDQELFVTRDMEDGFQTVRTTPPALLLSSTGLDEPRLPSLKGIMAAKRKPTETIEAPLAPTDRISWSEPFVPQKPILGTIVNVQDVPAPEAARQTVAWLKEHKLI